MTTILLKTKLHIPLARAELVRRLRLFEQLDVSLQRKLTLISAPAGFGKTTLISSWIKKRETPAAWLSLDKEDNNPERFWSYLIAALQTIETSIGEDLATTLQSSPSSPFETFLSRLLNEIEDLSAQHKHYSKGCGEKMGDWASDFLLILDDFHVIDHQQIQDGVQFLVDHSPSNMHLILSTRADPPWPIARWRGRKELVELRIDDLRFTIGETTEFLNSTMGLALTPEDVTALEARTEGWIAGLQMAALSMQGRDDKSDFISEFSGSHRFILDYLVEEVLIRQPAELQEFLLKTSILDRMTASLCDAILESNSSQSMLRQLEKTNLFLHSLDDERHWCRYHHLFVDLLRRELQQRFPDQVKELHRRASQWFAEYGMLPEAVNHAFLSGDIELVAQLIEENALISITVFNERLPSFVGWLDALPEGLWRSRPWLAVARAWVLAYSGELHAAETVIEEAEQVIYRIPAGTPPENIIAEHLAGYLAAIRGYTFVMKGDIACGTEWIEKAMLRLPKDDATTRAFSAVILGAALGMNGNLEGGIRVLSEAAGLWRNAQKPLLAIMVLCELAGLQILAGQLRQVISTCEEALHHANEYSRLTGLQPPSVSFAYSRLSYVFREQNDLESAIHYAQEAVSISRNWGQKDSLIIGLIYLALALQSAGKTEDAAKMMGRARQISGGLSGSAEAGVAAYDAKIHAASGDLSFVARWAEESKLNLDDEFVFERARDYIVYARALMFQDKLDESLALIACWLPPIEAAGSMLHEIELLILQALALHTQGAMEKAIIPLERALRLAEPEGYVRIFIDEGAKMRELLRQAAQRGICVNYVSRLLAILETIPQPEAEEAASDSDLPPARYSDPLTRREIEILRCLASILSIEQIANQLYISKGTLRTHIRNIYDKLGVHSRIEAVAAAREMKLK